MEIQRKVEKSLVTYLEGAVPGMRFFASDEDAELEPPYGVVAVDDDQSTLPADEASLLVVDVIWVTHNDDTGIEAHAQTVKAIRTALRDFPRGFQPGTKCMIHGLEVMSSVRVSDAKARGHAVTLHVGASDWEELEE